MLLLEGAVDSASDARRAVREGADRLEVCSRLDVGGLTPSAELVRACVGLGVPCVAMVRPRAGSFVYAADEMDALLRDADMVMGAGAGGVVFGALDATGGVDAGAVRLLVARVGPAEAVFHRAFDEIHDQLAALEVLIDCGVTRVLTSGGAQAALEGVHAIAALVERARGRIQILAGGGVRGTNVREIVRISGVAEVHARGNTAGTVETLRKTMN